MTSKIQFYCISASAHISGWAFGYLVASWLVGTWYINQWPAATIIYFFISMSVGTVWSVFVGIKQYRKLFKPYNTNLEGYYCDKCKCWAFLQEECVCEEGDEE